MSVMLQQLIPCALKYVSLVSSSNDLYLLPDFTQLYTLFHVDISTSVLISILCLIRYSTGQTMKKPATWVVLRYK